MLDAMELARNVHPDKEFVAAADGAYQLLGAHMETLNVDARLHGAVAAALDDPSSALSAEQRRFAHVMRAEFEHDGVHLRADEGGGCSTSARAERLGAHQHGRDGGPCSVGGEGVWVERDARAGDVRRGDAAAARRARARARRRAAAPRGAALRRHRARAAAAAPVQETLAPENRRARRAARDAPRRRRLPRPPVVRPPTAAHNSMEADPAFVAERLRALAAAAAPRARAELAEPTAAKARAEPPGARVRAWDLPFYTEAVRRDVSAVDDAELAQYFGRQACLDGLELVLKRAFGLVLRRAAAADGELWHASVRKTVLCRAATAAAPETPLGVLTDLFLAAARRSPLPLHAARRPHRKPPRRRRRRRRRGGGRARRSSTARAVPPRPPGGGARVRPAAGRRRYATASWRCCTTRRTRRPRSGGAHRDAALFGVRTALDFVEAPALLMEHFAHEPRALCAWARRGGADGAPMALELARRLRRARRAFVGLETEAQVLHSLVDLSPRRRAAARRRPHRRARARSTA